MAKPRLRKIVKIMLLIVVLLCLAGWLVFTTILPRIAQAKIKSALEAQGLGEVHLLPPDVGLYRTTVANLTIGDPARPKLQLASATVTYSPSQVFAGRVQDIVLNGLLLRVESGASAATNAASRPMKQLGPTTAPAEAAAPSTSPAGAAQNIVEPLFQSAVLSNARVELVDPQTGLPSSILVDAQARAGANRTIDINVSAGFGALRTQITGTADASFEKIDASFTARGITLDMLSPFIPSLPAKLRRPAEIDATVHVDRTAPHFDLSDLTVRVPAAAVDAGAQKTIEISDLVLNLAGSLHKYGSDWYLTLSKGPTLTIATVTPPEPFQALPLKLAVAPMYVRFNDDGWSISGSGAAMDIGGKRFGVDVAPFTIGTTPDGVSGNLSANLREIQFGRNRIIERLAPEIQQWNLSGKLAAGASLQIQGGTVKPRVRLRLQDCSADNRDYDLKIQGVNVSLAFTGFSPLRTDTEQTISAKYIQMGLWEIVDAEATFRMPGESRPTIMPDTTTATGNIVQVDSAKFGWAGGDVWCAPFEVNLARPRIRTELGAKDLDLSKVMWVASNKKAWAEGIVDLRLWADYSWPELRFGNGWASSRPDWRVTVTDPTKGHDVVLHLPDSAQQLDNWLRMRDPRFQDGAMLADVRKQVTGTIDSFYVTDFRADFSRETNGKQLTAIRLHGGGRESDTSTTAPSAPYDANRLDLTLSVSDLDILISHFLKIYSSNGPSK